jgi:tetratricopeptide (TPR) repeat protein
MANVLGSAYLGAHDGPRAEGWFRTALVTDPEFVDARLNLAATLEAGGKLDEAVAEFQKAYAKAPKREDISLSLALALERKRDFDGAEKIYERLLSTASGSVPTARAHAAAGRYYARHGDIDRARREGELLAAAEPGNPAAKFLLGIGLLADDKPADAIKSLREAVALDPQAQYHEGLGRALERQKSLGEAQQAYEQSVRLDGSYAPPLVGLGRLHLARRDFESARDVLERASRLEPGEAEVWVGIGDAFAGLRKAPEAVAAYQTALSKDDKNAETHYKMARVLIEGDRGSQAIGNLRRALDLAPAETEWIPEAWRLLGNRYYAAGQRGDMCVAFRKYLEVSPPTDLMRDEVKRQVLGCP